MWENSFVRECMSAGGVADTSARSGLMVFYEPIAWRRFSSSAPRKSCVFRNGVSWPTSRARSLVICPPSMVRTQTSSSVRANAVTPGHGAVGGFGLDGAAVRRHQHAGHQAERAVALGHHVRFDVAIVVLGRP